MGEGRQYWLMKSEPDVFSIDDLARSPNHTTSWNGVRNYQARNFMRAMKLGDQVLFYHSNANPPSVVGIAEVVKIAYPDATQFDPQDPHFDPASKPEQPRWDVVDIRFVHKFETSLSLDVLRGQPRLKGMELLRRGSRLSVQPVRAAEWNQVVRLGRGRADG
ncbi:MAG: EVE domain-containing protein [Nitrospira sp.]|uniref:EVE domain-containing protein n=1 Tax=Nitrospira defluvii TaxID=330214 RepID=A0ABM8QVR5_9BACT|nr:EVE domain-containing protein [Nitrospira defluvii]MCS6325814.1 EVE domain-containing protein [Nitrospira sp.]CAE6718032.1 EVE domain-containing protein [Nitrospira defluvii]